MTELKAVTETETLIKQIITKRNKDIEDITGKIETAKQNAAKAEEETNAAILTGDLKTYQAAKERKKNADDAVEMYTEMLNALKNKTLVSKEQYENTLKEIYAEVDTYIETSKKKLAKYMKPLEDLAGDISDTLNHTNNVLTKWQEEIGQIQPYTFNKKTGRQTTKEEVKGTAWNIYHYLTSILNDSYESIVKSISK